MALTTAIPERNAAAAAARVRGGDGLARRGDRRRAAARSLLRRLDDRLGEHDRGRCSWRCRSATGSAGGWPTAIPNMRGLCLLALAAAALLALVPFVADPLLDVAVDALDEISAGAFVGSLLGRARAGGRAGAAARRGLALGDPAGGSRASRRRARWPAACTRSRPPARSLGTLLSALLLIPLVGTRRTFLIFALAIAVVAVWGLRPVRRCALAPAAIAVLIALPVGTLKAETEGSGRVIHETETEYQYARVIEDDDGDADARAERGPGGALALPTPTPCSRRYWDGHLVLDFAACDRPPRAGGDSRQRRREPRRARTRSSSPTRAWTAWRSTRSCPRSGAGTST